MKLKIFSVIAGLALLFSACDEVLDRPSPTVAEDESYWVSAEKVRLYSNSFYLHYFEGYGTGWTHSSTLPPRLSLPVPCLLRPDGMATTSGSAGPTSWLTGSTAG